MALTDQLNRPAANSRQMGRYALNRRHMSEVTVAAPVAPVNISNIESIDLNAPTFDENKVFQQGGGDDPYTHRSNWSYSGTINVHKGKAPTVLSELKGITWDTSNDTMIPFRDDDDYPNLHWEAVCRDTDNETHLFTILIQDMIIDVPGFVNPMDYSDQTIPFHSSHMPMWLAPGATVVYDQFNGDGSTVAFTLSSTPLNLATASSHKDLVLDEIAFVKTKLSGENEGTRQMSGVSYAANDVTYTTAPAVGSIIQILYAA